MKEKIQEKRKIFGEELPPLPYSLQPRIQAVDGYARFRYVRAYLNRCFNRVPHNSGGTPLEWQEWMPELGMTNFSRFQCRLQDWLSLERPLPLKFLDLLGTDLEKLSRVLSLDRAAYEKALERACNPLFFHYFNLPSLSCIVPLPEGIDEVDAIRCAQEFLKRAKPNQSRLAFIEYRDLKCVTVFHETHRYSCYPPEISIRNGLIHFDLHAADRMIPWVPPPSLSRYLKRSFFRELYNRGVAFGNSGKGEAALECFDLAICTKPDEVAAWYYRGVALGLLGRLEEAVDAYLQFEKVSKEGPKNEFCRTRS